MLQNYKDYFKDNPEGYWFKRKIYGYGWTPVTWQGWAVTIGYIVAMVLLALTIEDNAEPRDLAFTVFLPYLLLTVTLVRIVYTKGEKPKWQWGLPKKDSSEESYDDEL